MTEKDAIKELREKIKEIDNKIQMAYHGKMSNQVISTLRSLKEQHEVNLSELEILQNNHRENGEDKTEE